jgi:hypothetical protein
MTTLLYFNGNERLHSVATVGLMMEGTDKSSVSGNALHFVPVFWLTVPAVK